MIPIKKWAFKDF